MKILKFLIITILIFGFFAFIFKILENDNVANKFVENQGKEFSSNFADEKDALPNNCSFDFETFAITMQLEEISLDEREVNFLYYFDNTDNFYLQNPNKGVNCKIQKNGNESFIEIKNNPIKVNTFRKKYQFIDFKIRLLNNKLSDSKISYTLR